MKIDLVGQTALVCGPEGPILDRTAEAVAGNGAVVERSDSLIANPAADLLIFGADLRLRDGVGVETAGLGAVGEAMRRRGSGRIIVLVSAVAAIPARRFPEASLSAGAAILAVRAMAMRLGPVVLVNAVGCGVIADEAGTLLSGDASLLSHVAQARSGTIEDIVHAVLFLCDPANSYMTGQLLNVRRRMERRLRT